MRMGWKTRLPIIVLLFVIFPIKSSFAKFWIEIKHINTGESITGSQYIAALKTFQIEGIEFTAHFKNETDDKIMICWLRVKPGTEPIPGYVDGWQDRELRLPPGEEIAVSNVVFIRPTEAGVDSFTVEIARRLGVNPTDPISASRTEIIVRTINASLDHPQILPEPSYTRGTRNSVRWIPVENSRIQEVYYFDNSDRTNLRKAVKGLYKAALSDTLSEMFTNLKSGHKYGFFAKAVYETENGEEAYYSDIVYSTQDNDPPEKVFEPQAILQRGLVYVSWNLVDDKLSGVQKYRVYRSTDSGLEKRMAEIEAEWLASGQWVDSSAVGGHYYAYRVRAVDNVGNEGDGDVSNSVSVEGTDDNIVIDDDNSNTTDDNAADGPFIAGSIDTMWVKLDNRERLIRFEAVRDSADYFNDPPNSSMRYFDSGWIIPDSLRQWGWVSPTNYDSVYFVFDYTKSENVRAKDDGGLFIPEYETFDKNFINGHTYFRKFSRKYFSTIHSEDKGSVIPDCFPPEDIHNLKASAVLEDPSTDDPASGYTSYVMHVTWEGASDDVSGLRKYHIFRKIGTEGSYSELSLPDDFKAVSYVDTLNHVTLNDISNPVVSYKVVAEDRAGNVRSVVDSDWESSERIPGRPVVVFSTTEYPDVFPEDPSEVDTIFTHENYVELSIRNFDTSDIISWTVLVNGREEEPYDIVNGNILIVKIDEGETSHIRVRGVYVGRRSSVWSSEKVVIRALSLAPVNVTISTDTSTWDGNIFLKWSKPCLASRKYLIWRKSENTEWSLVGTLSTVDESVSWTDFYDKNEITGGKGDTLVAYRNYEYQIQMVNVMGDTSIASPGNIAYCNKPPAIKYHDTPQVENSYFALTIHWRRVSPSDAADGFKTIVRVYADSLENTYVEESVVDDTVYTFRLGVQNHNYIFRVKEVPNSPAGRMSSWSEPHTISSLVTLALDVVPQPGGNIFVTWDDQKLIDMYKVEYFKVFRNEDSLTFARTVTSFMDSSEKLIHGAVYRYSVFAFDSLNQVVAANVKSDTVDTGSVFIPEVAEYSQKYFNSDSVTVSWIWRDITGRPVTNSTRGASKCKIQISVSKNFPDDQSQTCTIGPFDVEPGVTSRRIKIPTLSNRVNEVIYFRITAFDKWGHPTTPVWSTDFYPVKKAFYDPISPYPITNVVVDRVKSYFRGADSISVDLKWDATGVQVPGDTNEVWDNLIGNVAAFKIERITQDGTVEAGTVNVDRQNTIYTFTDVLPNRQYKWSIAVVDSAGNVVNGPQTQALIYMATPDPPEPVNFKLCNLSSVESEADTVYYFVEFAMEPEHFKIAYELNDEEMMNRLLCRSGWITAHSYECKTGWGSIEADTTWFRVKTAVKQNGQYWESGWSNLSYYTESDGGTAKPSELNNTNSIPNTFKISQNYPNPFNSNTVIPYQLPEASYVEIAVYNIAGSVVRVLERGEKQAGFHSVGWNGTDESGSSVSSGIYICIVNIRTDKGNVHQGRMKLMFVK